MKVPGSRPAAGRPPRIALGIKGKVFLPLAGLVMLLGTYLYGIWLPASVTFATQQSLGLLKHSLEIVNDAITPDLVADKRDLVTQRLDLILLRNPEWTSLTLKSMDGSVLYAQSGESAADQAKNIISVSQDLIAFGNKVGNLALVYDFSYEAELIRKHALNLLALLAGVAALFSVSMIMILQRFVIKPTCLLSEAAEKIASAERVDLSNSPPLPAITGDEIGRMTSSFSSMRMTIHSAQEALEKQNRDLFAAKEDAERLNRVKSEFLASMSHELRTPLNSILGMVTFLMEDHTLTKENREMAGVVHQSASSLLGIVNDILDLSKIETGKVVLERISFDVQAVFKTVIDPLLPIASAKGIPLECHYIQKELPYLIGDPARLARVLMNLAGNAIKYTEKGHVKVQVAMMPLSATAMTLSCRVTDTGIGIPQDQLDAIFEKFTQADASITRKYGGTGLGLAITKELVDLMGGEIGVESEPGKGSTFWFNIPFAVTDKIASPSAPQNQTQALSTPQTTRIPVAQARALIAEDHKLNQVFIRKLLDRMGFSFLDLEENGRLAVEAFMRKDYNIIFMDCHMPEMSGYEATEEIRKLESAGKGGRVPIIALTADAMTGTRKKCLAAGMDDYITKPIDTQKLRASIAQWLSFDDPAHKE